jgi:hypothetical protein
MTDVLIFADRVNTAYPPGPPSTEIIGECTYCGPFDNGPQWHLQLKRAISRDPEVFPGPEKFDLGRWLTSDGKLRDDLKFPYFGFGRR